jgi:branched-chain amino acid transport system permease protein
VLVAVAWGSYNLLHGKSGRAFRAIKDRDIAAAILGVNVARTKILVFILTSMLIGFQGSLTAYYVGVVNYESINLDVTVQYVAMIIIGGIATISGSIIGAIFVVMLPFVVQALVPLIPTWFLFYDQITGNVFAVQSILYGLAIIIFMRVAPRGLVSLFRRLGTWLIALVTRSGKNQEAGA